MNWKRALMKTIMNLRMLVFVVGAIVAAAGVASADVPPPPPLVFIFFFGSDSSELTEEGRLVVAEAASAASIRPTIEITGRADASEQHPIMLARRRAEVVRQALIGAGVPGERIKVRSEEIGALMINDGSGTFTPRSRLVLVDVCNKPVRCRG